MSLTIYYKEYVAEYVNEQYVTAAVAVLVVLFVQSLSQIITLARLKSVINKIDAYIPRFHVKSEIKKTILLFIVAFAIFFIRNQQHNAFGTEHVPERPIYASLKIDKPGKYTPTPTKRCYPIDLADPEQRDAAVHVMNHMKLFIPPGHVMVSANEFDSNGAQVYSVQYGHINNPVITPLSKERKWVQCQGKRVERFVAIKVKYRDREFEEQEVSMYNNDALHMQCMIITFNI